MSLTFDVDAAEAAWLTAGLAGTPRAEVWQTLLLGPSGFEAYARFLDLPDPRYPSQQEAEVDESTMDSSPSEIEDTRDTIETLSDGTGASEDRRFLLRERWPYDPDLPTGNRINVGDYRRCALARGTLQGRIDRLARGNPGDGKPRDQSLLHATRADPHRAVVWRRQVQPEARHHGGPQDRGRMECK